MLHIDNLANGLTVIVEHMPYVESEAVELFIPGGLVGDEANYEGASLILAELTSRGAGGLVTRELSEQFDEHGIRHSEAAELDRYTYRCSLLAEHLEQALRLVSLMVCQPALPEDQIKDIKNILLQDLDALIDNPAQRAMVELGKLYYPEPWGRCGYGTRAGLQACNIQTLSDYWRTRYGPQDAVLSLAGKVDIQKAMQLAERYFADWKGGNQPIPHFGPMPEHKAHHIAFDSAQLQIAMQYPSTKFGEEHYYSSKIATGVLSGGMFGRLFAEVREKRGLCYSVHARHVSTQHYGAVTLYAGTTPDRAHQTLEVILMELRGLQGTVSEAELRRSKANLCAALIIGEESSASRASSNAWDWWVGKRVRSMEEIHAGLEAVSLESIDRYLSDYALDSFMLVTLGPRKLEIPG